jgi:hypothetical protein
MLILKFNLNNVAKINPEEWYSLLQVQKLTGIKSRQYLAKYINERSLLAIQTGAEGVRIRYAILGEWVIDFMKRYKRGLVKGKKYSKEEARALLEEAIKNLK